MEVLSYAAIKMTINKNEEDKAKTTKWDLIHPRILAILFDPALTNYILQPA
jgi:hypothetical protein